MTRISKTIASLPKTSPSLMTHVVLGYPTMEKSLEIVIAMAESGTRFIELQIPFSDPLADGPTIMHANEVALANGVTPTACLAALKSLRSEIKETPLLIMSYFNLLFNYRGGVQGFIDTAQEAGADGFIVPDIPPDEVDEKYWSYCRETGLAAVPLVSPVTPDSRMELIARNAQADSFIYCVSTTGTTGAREQLSVNLEPYITRVKKYFSQPLALGFGIKTKEQIQQLSGLVDIAIVGSATIDRIERYAKNPSAAQHQSEVEVVKEFIQELV